MVARPTSKTAVLVVATLPSFMAPFMISAVNIALPAIQAEFGANAILLSWMSTAYLLATGVLLVPAGKLADIYGRKRMFSLGVAIFTLFTLSLAFSPSALWIIGLRIFQGLGAAMILTTGIAMLTSVFPPNERGKVIGINVTAVYIGLSAGPFVGGLLTGLFGWRSIFLVSVPIGIATLILILTTVHGEWADAVGERLDYLGSLLYGAALVSLMYGLSILIRPLGWGLLLAGGLGLAAFVRQQLHTAFPVFEVRLFVDNRPFTFSSLAALISYAATFAVSFLLSLYLQTIKGMSPQSAGIVLVSQPVVMALFSPLAGRLSDRVEPALIASVGMAITAAGLVPLIFLGPHSGNAVIIVSLIVQGIGFALFSSPNMNAIMSSVPKRYYGVAAGAVATMRLVGQMSSMALATLIFALRLGSIQITPEHYGAFLDAINLAFIIFTGFCVVGIYFSLARGKLRSG